MAESEKTSRYIKSDNGNVGPIDSLQMPRFAGLATFARLPRIDEVDHHDIAIVGIPFDAGVSYRPGARFAPSAIRESSRLLRPYNFMQDSEPFALAQVVDAGDIGVNPFNISEAVATIEKGIAPLYQDKKSVVALGGDHTVALPILRAINKVHGPVALIHFDAHLDTWDTYFGEPCTHGTPFRRATEEGLLIKDASVHIGLRGPLYDRQDLLDDARLGFTAITAQSVPELGIAGVLSKIKTRVGSNPVYISIDVDVMDPAFTPGTGTPEAGGLSSREMLAILRGLDSLNIIGADIVEVAPIYDHAEITCIAASHLAYELITLLARQKNR